MSDIRFFFAGKPSAGGGGSKAESGRPRPSSPSKKASASSSSASSRAFDGGSGDGSNGGSARKERKVKTSKADDDSKAGARPAGRVKVDPLQPEKRRSDQKESGRRSSYFSHMDEDDDAFVQVPRAARSSSSKKTKRTGQRSSPSNGDGEDDEEWRADEEAQRTPSKGGSKKKQRKSPEEVDEIDAAFAPDDEGDEEMFDEEEQPLRRRAMKAAASASSRRKKSVLRDEEDEVGEDGEQTMEVDEEGEEERPKASITKHFEQTTSAKQRTKEQREKEAAKKAAEDAVRREREEKEAAVADEKRKVKAQQDRRRMDVIDEDTAFSNLDSGKPNTDLPSTARSAQQRPQSTATASPQTNVDPLAYFSNPAAIAKPKLSAKDRVQASKRDIEVVDVDADDEPEAAATATKREADRRTKAEEDSLALAMKLQAEEDQRARSSSQSHLAPSTLSSSSSRASPPKSPAKRQTTPKKATPTKPSSGKRVKREVDDEEEEEGSSKKKRKMTFTPHKHAKPAKAEKEEKTASKAKGAAVKEAVDPYAEEAPKAKPNFRAFLAASADRPPTLGMVKEQPEGAPGCLKDLTFVISGILDSLERDEAKTLIERYGGRVTAALSGKTTFLLLGDQPGKSKLDKKDDFPRLKTINEDGLFDLIRTRKGHDLSGVELSKVQAASAKTKQKASTAQVAAQGVSAKVNANTDTGKERLSVHGKMAERAEDMLWVEKHRPMKLTEIIGNAGLVGRLSLWLKTWENTFLSGRRPDRDQHRAVLISGPPGLGKSTSASLVAREAGFHVVEFNASDVRNKAALKSYVGQLLDNRGMDEFYSSDRSSHPHVGKKTVVIMDEVDGISGNEDRGGLQQLVQLIKRSSVPVICIANDVSKPNMKTLKSYVVQMPWRRPTPDQIVPRISAIAQAEGLDVDVNALKKLIESTHTDIRQSINFLQMYAKTHRKLGFDNVMQVVQAAGGKDFDAGVFEIVPTFFKDPGRKGSWVSDRIDLFFMEPSLVPLFVQELYLKGRPRMGSKAATPRELEVQAMEVASKAADYITDADIVSSNIYRDQDYALMPTHAVMSSVAPAWLMSAGGLGGQVTFPVWLGRNSTRLKMARLTREMHTAMTLASPSPLSSFTSDVVPALRSRLIDPFKSTTDSSATVQSVVDQLDELGLSKDDWDTVLDLTNPFTPQRDQFTLDSAVKSRFTKEWRKRHQRLTANRGLKGGKAGAAPKMGVDELEEEGSAAEDDEEDDDDDDPDAPEDEGKEGSADAAAATKKDRFVKDVKIELNNDRIAGWSGTSPRGKGARGKGSMGGGGGRGGAGRGQGRGRGGRGSGGKGATKGGRGGRGGGGGSKKAKQPKDEKSEDEEDEEDDDDFIDDDDDDQ